MWRSLGVCAASYLRQALLHPHDLQHKGVVVIAAVVHHGCAVFWYSLEWLYINLFNSFFPSSAAPTPASKITSARPPSAPPS